MHPVGRSTARSVALFALVLFLAAGGLALPLSSAGGPPAAPVRSGPLAAPAPSPSAPASSGAALYSLIFEEVGLPGGANWSVTVDGTTLTSAAVALTFTEANGTFDFQVAPETGYRAEPASGVVTVAGSSVISYVVFVVVPPTRYAVTFSEAGLPAGTAWSVTVNGTTASSTTSTLSVGEVNGSYAYLVGNVAGLSANPSSGTFTVSGSALARAIEFVPLTLPDFPVTFVSFGLPSGTPWAIAFGGAPGSPNASRAVTFSAPNGSYGFSAGAPLGYAAQPSSGTIDVQGAGVTIDLAFAPASTVALGFSEVGLPKGTPWSVFAAGTAIVAASGSAISFAALGESAEFTVGAVPGFSAAPSSGVVSLSAGPASRTITFSATVATHAIDFSETGLPPGTSWSVLLAGVARGSSGSAIVFREPNANYTYTVNAVPGYSATPRAGEARVNGSAVPVAIAFALDPATRYAVNFTETGLPAGTPWSVTLGGSTLVANATGANSTVAFEEPNGTYAYSVGSPDGAVASPSSGTVGVGGASPAPVPVAFAPSSSTTYTLRFVESGLTSGASWSVSLNGTTQTASAGQAIMFAEPNGSYSFTVSSPSREVPTPSTSSVQVKGAGVVVPVSFGPAPPETYPVTFLQDGLPAGTNWSVELAGGNYSSATGGAITVLLPNGTAAYALAPIANYTTAYRGAVTVDGAGLTVPVMFSLSVYSVVFHESGLAPGTSWTVSADGISTGANASGVTVSLTLDLPNGTYLYSITPIAGYSTAWTGAVLVNGRTAEVSVNFAEEVYPVTFTAVGLAAGTPWSLLVDSELYSSATATIGTSLPNGTFSYSIDPVAGYTLKNDSGRFTVAGGSLPIAVVFVPYLYAVSFVESGLPNGSWGVTLSGLSGRAPVGAPIVFGAPNGTAGYNLSLYAGYRAVAERGAVTVRGAPLVVNVTFARLEYSVALTEGGLPAATNWSVSLGGVSANSTAATITFLEPNGTYTAEIADVPGYVPTPSEIGVLVDGGEVALFVAFRASTFSVTFTESGLPAAATWSVSSGSVNGSAAAGAPIVLRLPNGSDPYTVGPVPGYRTTWFGVVQVLGGPTGVPVTFSAFLYPITFSEQGLRASLPWSAALAGSSEGSTTAAIEFFEPNGSYPFETASDSPSWQTTLQDGLANVSGQSVSITVPFSFAYVATFKANLLPSGTTWYVNLTGNLSAPAAERGATASPATTVNFTFSGESAALAFSLPNGSYRYTVGSNNPAWTPPPRGTALMVAGASPPVQSVSSSQGLKGRAPIVTNALTEELVVGLSVGTLLGVGAVAYRQYTRPPRYRPDMSPRYAGYSRYSVSRVPELGPGGSDPDTLGDIF